MLKSPRARRKALLWCAALALAAFLVLPPLWRRVAGGGDPVVPDAMLYPVRGIDISAHNGEVDFEEVKRQGYSFVLIKASEGTAFKDSRFLTNISRARRAGLKVGAYHFFRFDATAYMQSLNFMHSLRGQKLDLPVVIDIEQWTNPNDRPARSVMANLRSLLRELEEQGHAVMLYTNKKGYDKFLAASFSGYPLWLCSFTEIEPDVEWTLWQYTHSGNVAGVKGKVDLNVFNGTEAQWRRWCAKHSRMMQ